MCVVVPNELCVVCASVCKYLCNPQVETLSALSIPVSCVLLFVRELSPDGVTLYKEKRDIHRDLEQ